MIGICGYGIVGQAIDSSFKKHDIQTIIYDKYKSIGSLDDLFKCDVVFVSVSTNYDSLYHLHDISELYSVCGSLKKYEGVIVIKSTVPCGTSENIANKHNLEIIHNPEFLTERTAPEDFHNQSQVILGMTSVCKQDKLDYMIKFYTKYYPNASINICTSNESEIMKLTANAFYATKVQFFTEIYELCEKLNISYDNIKYLILKMGWVNPMHTNVPGPDGNVSFGGKCLPKDTDMLLQHMNDHKTNRKVISAVVKEQQIMRN